MAVNIKTTVFWDVTTCSSLNSYESFERGCCLHLQDRSSIMTEYVASSSDTLLPT